MKRIDIYLQNAVVALVFTLTALPAAADVQINQQTKKYHSPWSEDVNNDEFKITFSGPTGCIGDNCASVRAIEREVTYLCWDLPQEILNLAQGETLWVYSSQVNADCTVTDPDGNETTLPVWSAGHYMHTDLSIQPGDPGYHNNVCRITQKLWCSNSLP